MILSACYMLWLYQRVFYGETPDEVRHHMFDLKLREWAAIVPLIVHDGLDGRVFAIVPARRAQHHRAHSGSDAGERAGPRAGARRARDPAKVAAHAR